MQPAIDHRPVYGSTEKDEFICSCGWTGATSELPAHYEQAAELGWKAIEAFAMLLEQKAVDNRWEELRDLEDEPAYLSPDQFLAAMRNQRLKHPQP